MQQPGDMFPVLRALRSKVGIGVSVDGTPAATDTPREGPDFAALNAVRYSYRGPDVGVGGALKEGVKTGLTMPFNIFTPGVRQPNPEIDTGGEKVANFIGTMVGLGIGFYPITRGVGLAMRGIGLTGSLSAPVADFVKYTLAGGIQAAGTAETIEEVPGEAYKGVLAGAAIDLFFLSRAMRGRAPDLGTAKSTGTALVPVNPKPRPLGPDRRLPRAGGTSGPIDVDYVILESTTEAWPPGVNVLSLEQALKPTEAHASGYARQLVQGLDDKTKGYPQVVADLTGTFEETAVVTGLRDLNSFSNYVKESIPGAQVVSRQIFPREAVYEVLVHNPIDPTDLLNPLQIAQWQKTRFFEGMEVSYRGQKHAVGKEITAPGRVQLKNENGVTFAAKTSEVILPTLTRNILRENARRTTLRGQIKSWRSSSILRNRIGFKAKTGDAEGMAGSVDVSGYARAPSLYEYFSTNQSRMLARGLDTRDVDTATRQFLELEGYKGFIEQEGKLVKRVHVYDPETIIQEGIVPVQGTYFDEVAIAMAPDGAPQIQSFVPSWRGSTEQMLREMGYVDKQIDHYIDLARGIEMEDMIASLDNESLAALRASEGQFYGGCI